MATEVLTGLFALGGLVFTGVFALIGYWMRIRQEFKTLLRTRHFERRLDVYDRVLDFAGATYQTGRPQPPLDQIRLMNRELLIVGSPEVIEAFNQIADTSADHLRAAGVSEPEIRQRQTGVYKSLVNAIRSDLYPDQRRIEEANIRFVEPKQTGP